MRRRPALSPRVLLLLLVAAGGWGAAPVAADGNVGCLFSESLCTEKVEWCYDDYAFGKCLQVYGNVEEEDLVRHELTTEELRELERELQRLLQLGYRWSHAYTQCVLQAMLYSIHNRVHYESTVCDHLADQDLTAALGAFEADEEVDPQSVAFVRYTPNNAIQESDFADEVYYPPSELELLENLPVQSESETPPEEIPENSDDFDWSQYHKRAFERDERMSIRSRRNQQESQTFSRIYNTPKNFREGYETKDFSLDNIEQIIANNEKYQSIPYQDIVTENDKNNIGLTPEDILYLMQPENQEELHAALPQFIDAADNSFGAPDVSYSQILPKDPMNKWLENQDLDQLRAALAELKEPFKQNPDPYYVSTSEFLTKNRLRPDRFNQHYNTPDRFRQGYESRDGVLNSKYEEGDMPEPRIYIDEDEQDHYREESGSGEHDGRPDTLNQLELLAHNVVPQNEYPAYEEMYRGEQDSNVDMDEEQQAALLSRLVNTWRSNMYNQRPDQHERPHAGGQAFTEGGLVYVADPSDPTTGDDKAQLLSPELGALLADYEEGFRRRERLDVKKPGPPFDVKNHHFKHNTAENQTNAPDTEGVVAPLMVKKELHDKQEQIIQDDHHVSYVVDNSYAYVGVKDTIRTWEEGESVIRAICNLLHLEPSAVTHHRVDRNEVTFRVGENKQGLNASEVASRIDGIKGELKNALGIEVTSAGLGDKAKYPAVLKLEANSGGWEELWTSNWGVGVAVASGGVAALMAATALFLLVRQRRHKHDKLRNLAGGDTEASQDYQDLCRARMSGKWSPPSGGGAGEQKAAGDKPETTGQRITSLSRESDGNSPSTRSSTSSWSEEPALTNMDISTGHMVLTYMEDHLKNKDRLEQEWQALCAYEAEPSAALAAQTTENAPKNRTPGVLPYDHARLVLNDVTNHNSSDYINASTITDHDPRNPAYIAAQGPLAQTAPDFWQMVWEQGSVVMVMLTRLTEAGQPMCHRYWPEEGSDLYHIYEVHLVSEHIWCDDYLVRSFYLKNLKTGETRTVTQFHFLSWPDRGVPSSTKALLEFRRKVNKSYRGRSCPIVVHCSDGAGRTGTYCLIDMVLNRMAKGAKEIDIAATLEHIRDQRPHMVTTKQQFEFVLMAVAEEVHAILKALPAQLQQQHEKREKELAAEKEKQDKEKLVKEK